MISLISVLDFFPSDMSKRQNLIIIDSDSWAPREQKINKLLLNSSSVALKVIPEEGNLCRAGKLSFLVISTKTCHLVFDLLNVKKEDKMMEWLETFLMGDMTKIMDDCRMASDALYHKFSIWLSNVHDVSAWDLVLSAPTKKIYKPRNFSAILHDHLAEDSLIEPRERRKGDWMGATTEDFMGDLATERPISMEMVQKVTMDTKNLFFVAERQENNAQGNQGLNANIQCMKHLEVRKMKVAKLRAPIPSLLNRTNTTKLHVRFNVQFFRWRGNGSSAASISSSASTNIPSLSSFAPSSAGEKKQFLEFLMYYQRKKSLRMVQELIEEKVEEENSFENREDTGGLLESFVWFCFLSTEIPVWSFFGERK